MRFLFVAEWFRIIAEKNFNDKAIFAIDYWIFISVFFMAPKNYAVVGLYNSIKNLNGHNQTAKFVFALFKFQNTLTKLKEMGRVDKTT